MNPHPPNPQSLSRKDKLSLMLCLTKNIHGAGNIIVLDYGFFFFQGFLDIEKKGVYLDSVINKRRYWTHYIDGDNMEKNSLKAMWGLWVHFTLILKMCSFMSLI